MSMWKKIMKPWEDYQSEPISECEQLNLRVTADSSVSPHTCLKCSGESMSGMCVVYCTRLMRRYTRFSIPGRGCWMGAGGSVLLACWASCKTGMLHSGHTFLTSSHLMRHLRWKACLHGHIPSSSFCLNSSKHTAQISCKFNSLTFSFWMTCL